DFGVGSKYTKPGNSDASKINTSSFIVEVAVCVLLSNLLCAYLVGIFLPFPALIYSSAFFQLTAAIKSLSFCDAFTSNKLCASSVLYVVKKNHPCDFPLPGCPKS